MSISAVNAVHSIAVGRERAMVDVVAQRRRRDAVRCGADVSVRQSERALCRKFCLKRLQIDCSAPSHPARRMGNTQKYGRGRGGDGMG